MFSRLFGKTWGSPQAGPQQKPSANPARPASPKPTVSLEESAALAEHAYDPSAPPPQGWTLRPDVLAPNEAHAQVYTKKEQAGEKVAVAFPGTGNQNGWGNNFRQALGWNTAAHAAATRIGKQLAGSDVTFTGHSQGGGLAETAGAAHGGNPAVHTFNPAGVHPNTHNGNTPSSKQVNVVTAGDPINLANKLTGLMPGGKTQVVPPKVPAGSMGPASELPATQFDDWSAPFRHVAAQGVYTALANHSIPAHALPKKGEEKK